MRELVATGGLFVPGEDLASLERSLNFICKTFGLPPGEEFKLHPDYRYVNLYHWLLGDSHYLRNMGGWPLPFQTRPYAQDAATP